MSDLWNRCLTLIRRELSAAEWDRCFDRLRSWIDAGTLYLWIERPRGDWRRTPVEAREYERLIRSAFQRISGRQPVAIHYLETPPNHEHILTTRRVRQHREQRKQKAPLELLAFRHYYEQALAELRQSPPHIPARCADPARYVQRRVETLATQRLEKQGIPASIRSRRRAGGRRKSPRPAPAPPPPARSAADSEPAGPAELRAAMRELGWLDEDQPSPGRERSKH